LPILLYLALGPSAAAYACWNVAVRDLGAAYAAMFNNVLPIFGMLLGWLVLHERVTFVQVFAASLIIAGIVIAYRSLPMTSAAPRRSRAR
ncbi:MAG: DMT family transporter, partial [Bacillati bacterium ANGP1]